MSMLRSNSTLSFKNYLHLPYANSNHNFREVKVFWTETKPDIVEFHLGNVDKEAANGGYCGCWTDAKSVNQSVNQVLSYGFNVDSIFNELKESPEISKMVNAMIPAFALKLRVLAKPSIIV